MISADKVLSEPQLNKLLRRLKSEKDKSILAICNSSKRNPKEVRIVIDFFLFTLIANTGLRISEALNLKWSDVHEDFLMVRPEISKNKRRGTVYFGLKTQAIIQELKDVRTNVINRKSGDFLFSLNGSVPSRSFMHLRFKYWLEQNELPSQFSIHSLRHTYGTMCLDKGLPLTFVRDNLRHSSVAVTSQYLHLTKESREKVRDLF
ncbi:MAG: site-specific integrase [Bdellovibrionota bacterium]